jgi:hypothetical protein
MECSPSTASGGTPPRVSGDAAIVLALAATALPFATSLHEEAERWLRLLRMHGEVGIALQSLGIGEVALDPASPGSPAIVSARARARGVRETVDLVGVRACDLARSSGASTVGTVHVLFAVLSVYGAAFDHELYRRGGTRDELFGRLARDERARAARVAP